jgi:hypothetical protein
MGILTDYRSFSMFFDGAFRGKEDFNCWKNRSLGIGKSDFPFIF